MKTISFQKYHGTGNDFIMIDDRVDYWRRHLPQATIRLLCDRHLGIGADGLILLQDHEVFDFIMYYYNADGKESTMCGNGGRCLVAFANSLGIFDQHCTFDAIDGIHKASLQKGQISLGMKNVKVDAKRRDLRYFLDTGSPHLVEFTPLGHKVDFYKKGMELRYDNEFAPGGTNVNFVSILEENKIQVTTYERGVEGLTLSCGTGVVASAIAYAEEMDLSHVDVIVKTDGGKLRVQCERIKHEYKNVILHGPAKKVFSGQYDL